MYQSTHLKVATSVYWELIRGETGCRPQSFEPRGPDLTALKPFSFELETGQDFYRLLLSPQSKEDRTCTDCLYPHNLKNVLFVIEFTRSLMRFLICSEFWFLVYSRGERRFVVYPDQLVVWAPVYRLSNLLAHCLHLLYKLSIQHHIRFSLEYEILKPQCIHHL